MPKDNYSDSAGASSVFKNPAFRSSFKKYMDEWNALTPEEQEKRELKTKEKRDKELKMYLKQLDIDNAYRAQTSLSLEDAEKYTWKTFKATAGNESAARLVKAWSPSKMDVGLFLFGNCGTGKTHMLKALIQHNHSEQYTFRYVQAVELINEFKQFDYQKEAMAKYCDKYALVIDDLGVLSGTDFENQTLFRILEGRRSNGKVTFLCCDVSGDELKQKFDQRILDRLKEFTVPIHVKGETHRKNIMMSNLQKLQALASDDMESLAHEDTRQMLEDDRQSYEGGESEDR